MSEHALSKLASQYVNSEYNLAKMQRSISQQTMLSQAADNPMPSLTSSPCSYQSSPSPKTPPPASHTVCTTAELSNKIQNLALRSDVVAPSMHPSVSEPIHSTNHAIRTSVTHPLNVSPLVPTELLPAISCKISQRAPWQLSDISPAKPWKLAPTLDICDLTALPLTQTIVSSLTHPLTSSSSPIGNLFLSSCPGKKVRLAGDNPPPVLPPGMSPSTILPQRSPIRRDVKMDLERARDIADIKVVVCCLFDDEMERLGAPWPEYQQTAEELGLDVVRIPMIEGFAPPSSHILDSFISHLVTTYTLKGHGVLVHCRGGIGRAGLVACAWLLKLSLVRDPLATSVKYPLGSTSAEAANLRLIERVIAIVRRRRSVKSIETPVQVKAIMDYVAFLYHAQIIYDPSKLGDIDCPRPFVDFMTPTI